MPTPGARTGRRGLAGLLFATLLSALTVTGGAAAERTFDISGTVSAVQGQILTIVTSDVVGSQQPIMVDVSQLPGLQIKEGDPIQLTIRSRESDTYLALGIGRESPYVNGQEFGVREGFTVKQDSIQAGVGNVPEDDEALAQQHRHNNLRRDDDDDKKKGDKKEK